MWSFVPARVARHYLDDGAARAGLLAINALGVLIGLNFYLPQMAANSLFLWPLIIDSPLALFWLAASLLTLVPVASIDDYPFSQTLALINTLAFASAVKYGVWTAITLNLFFSQYFPDLWGYFGILVTHLVMVFEAFLLPYYAKTSRLALGVTAVWLFANDVADYGFGLYPHLRVAGPGPLVWITPVLTLVSLGLAAYCMDLPGSAAGRANPSADPNAR